MGAPKFQRKKYSKPAHPWQRERIEIEKELVKGFGLKNKKEIWKADSLLRKLKTQAKRLISEKTEQARKEEVLFRKKLAKYDLLPENFILEDVLSLQTKDILNLRLQTQVFKHSFSKTVKQARQFISHGHILINDKKIDIPSYLVLKTDKLLFSPRSKLSDTEHPERPKEKLIVKTQLKLPKKEPSLEEPFKKAFTEKVHEEKKEKVEEKKETKEEKPKGVKSKKTKKEKPKEEKVPTAHELAEKKKETKK